MVLASRWRLLSWVVTCLLVHTAWRIWAAHHGLITIPPARPDHLRIVDWNLRNFPDGPAGLGPEGHDAAHDRERLRQRLAALDPDVVAFQEVLDPSALPDLLPHFSWHASQHGGRHGQHVVIGWNPATVEVTSPREHTALTMDDRVRPALSAHVRERDADHHGLGFHLMVVHLKATRDGLPTRRTQWLRLIEAIVERRATAPHDDDLVLLGDFNVAGGATTSSTEELAALGHGLAALGLRPWTSVGGCTAYWQGARRDAWWQPSRLDLVWTAGFADLAEDQRHAVPGTHCARRACRAFRATEHHPDPDLHGISDHCPIIVDLPRRRAG